MPYNKNDFTKEMLSWHGHDRGGVRVPFQGESPLARTIPTPILDRLRALAESIVANRSNVRSIFLVGGPGNGKSEAVQSFVADLDQMIGAAGGLTGLVSGRFHSDDSKPRRVDVVSTDFSPPVPTFSERIGHLIIVQDASVTEDGFGNAAKALCQDLTEVQVQRSSPSPLLVVCANRGLLARAIRETQGGTFPPEVRETLVRVSEVTAVSQAALAGQDPACWPTSESTMACWPLDSESLFETTGSTAPVADQIIQIATAQDRWELVGKCTDCDARHLCPFRQNASWLREEDTRKALVTLLRRGELGVGRRLTFRDAFSLVVELMVGEWDDFGSHDHPCKWVQEQASLLTGGPPAMVADHASNLLGHLYPHAFFPGCGLQERAARCRATSDSKGRPVTSGVASSIPQRPRSTTSNLRSVILPQFRELLDPASDSPPDNTSELRLLEDSYSQSVAQGNGVFFSAGASNMEQTFHRALEEAEAEWTNVFDIDYSTVYEIQRFLRSVATILAKRSVGVRLCHHGNETALKEYHALLRSPDMATLVRQPLKEMLGKDAFRFGSTEALGRPRHSQGAIILEGVTPGITVVHAPLPRPDRPLHDLPIAQINTYRVPLTFDLFMALKLSLDGCANSSLPASVRAALDRVRHRQAGQLCRDVLALSNGQARFRIEGKPWVIELDPASHVPRATKVT